MTSVNPAEKRYFYLGVNHPELAGKRVTSFKFKDTTGTLAQLIQGSDAATILFKVEGSDQEYTSHYRWAFWEDSEESRAAYAAFQDMDKQRDNIQVEQRRLASKFVL